MAQSAKSMFERGYLMDMDDACGQSFVAFGQAIFEEHRVHKVNKYDELMTQIHSSETSKPSKEGILVGLLNRWSASSH
jgi:hypothetical protein